MYKRQLDEEFEQNKTQIVDKLNKLVGYIFNKDNVIVSLTADDEGYDCFVKALSARAVISKMNIIIQQ